MPGFSMNAVPRRWIQTDFDIPENETSARNKLVNALYRSGARRLSLSVYHLPFSQEAMEAIEEAAKIPGATVHVVRPEYELIDANSMAQRYVDDVCSAMNHAEQVTEKVEEEYAAGEIEIEKAVPKLKRMLELLDLADPAARRIGDKQLDIQLREVRAYVELVLKRISPKALVGAGVKAWATRRANAAKKKTEGGAADKTQETKVKSKSKKNNKTSKVKASKKQVKQEQPAEVAVSATGAGADAASATGKVEEAAGQAA